MADLDSNPYFEAESAVLKLAFFSVTDGKRV